MKTVHTTWKRLIAIMLAFSLALMMPATAFAQPGEDGAADISASDGADEGGAPDKSAGGGAGEDGAPDMSVGDGVGEGGNDASGDGLDDNAGTDGTEGEELLDSIAPQSDALSDAEKAAQSALGAEGGTMQVAAAGDRVTIWSKSGDDVLEESYTAPESVNLEVYINGAPIADTEGYGFEWFNLVSAVGEAPKWDDFVAPNMERQTDSTIDITATVQSQLGSLVLYCEVTDPGGTVLNPIVKEGGSLSDPMKMASILLVDTSVVFAAEGGSVGLRPGESKSGVSLSADGKTITLDNFKVDASNFKDAWLIAALSIEVPDDEKYQDITIKSIGTNSLACVLNPGGLGEANDGWGLYVEAMGAHTVTLIGDELSVTGGYQGFYAGGNNGEGVVEYVFDGGLSLTLKNVQTAPVPFPGALVLSRSSGTFKDVHATIISNSPIGIRSFHLQEDAAKDITLLQGADVSVVVDGEGFRPDFGILEQGILIDFGDLVIEGGKLSVVMSNISLLGITGIVAGNLSVSQGGALNVSIDQSRNEESGGQTGIKLEGNLVVDASTVVVDCIGHVEEAEASARCIISNGANSSIVQGSSVTLSSQAAGPACGIECISSDLNEYAAVLTVENSAVSAQATSSGKEAVGIAADMLSITEDASHVLTANAVGGTYGCSIIATETYSARDPKYYTAGYKPTRWSLGANTVILTPSSAEINLFSFEEANGVGYVVGESVYAPGVTDKTAQNVVVGYQKNDPGPTPNPTPTPTPTPSPTPKPIPPTGDPLASFPVAAMPMAALAGLMLVSALLLRRRAEISRIMRDIRA